MVTLGEFVMKERVIRGFGETVPRVQRSRIKNRIVHKGLPPFLQFPEEKTPI